MFYSDVRDKIQSEYINKKNSQGKLLRQFKNVGDAKFYGFELSAVWFLANELELGANYTYMDYDLSSDEDGKEVYLSDVPRHKFFAYLDWEFAPKWSLYASGEIQSKSLSSYNNDEKYYARGFGVTNLKVGYEPFEGLKINAGVNNIFDKYYEYTEGYSEDGRTFFVNLRYDF
ncbi:TonB-dependent receptor domain-containing protein [Campylobacter corcagiensis]|uniref:TonB-dependent receptor domain-containing protein n=1 Tax=Campylobacter corcagiensis TaxID=1448857 RepID=UPI001E42141E|nr:TonB-dependent receptor [Campylobacter corcagiensis]